MSTSRTTPAPRSAPVVRSSAPAPTPTPEQQRVLDRIALQRERLRARRAARAQARALAEQTRGAATTSGSEASLALRAAVLAKEHPLAVAAIAGVALVAGPRRLVRWAGIVLPMVMRLRR